MIKTDGKAFDYVVAYLEKRGVGTDGLSIATLSRGTDHLIIKDKRAIGEYNHKSKQIILYSNEE